MILRELSSSCIILVQQCFAGWTNLNFNNMDSRLSTILCNHHRTCKCSYASKLFLPHPHPPSTLLSPFSPRGTRVLELWILLLLPNELPTPESSERSVNGRGRGSLPSLGRKLCVYKPSLQTEGGVRVLAQIAPPLRLILGRLLISECVMHFANYCRLNGVCSFCHSN